MYMPVSCSSCRCKNIYCIILNPFLLGTERPHPYKGWNSCQRWWHDWSWCFYWERSDKVSREFQLSVINTILIECTQGCTCSWENSRLSKIFIELVTIFHERTRKNVLSSIFCNPLDAGLPSFVFIRFEIHAVPVCGKRTCYRSAQNWFYLLLVIVEPILKVVRNLCQTFHLDSSKQFRYWIMYLHNLKTIHCPLPSDQLPKSSWQSPGFLSHCLATTHITHRSNFWQGCYSKCLG